MGIQEKFLEDWKACRSRVLRMMKFFAGILRGRGGCYLSVVLRHAGAFGNKVVRFGEQEGPLFVARGLAPVRLRSRGKI
jgi:hypothetical protein